MTALTTNELMAIAESSYNQQAEIKNQLATLRAQLDAAQSNMNYAIRSLELSGVFDGVPTQTFGTVQFVTRRVGAERHESTRIYIAGRNEDG